MEEIPSVTKLIQYPENMLEYMGNPDMSKDQTDSSNEESILPVKNEKKKRRKQSPRDPYVTRIVIDQSVLENNPKCIIGYLDANYNFQQLKYELRETKVKKTPEEKADQRREYRKIYFSDPEKAENAKRKLLEQSTVEKRKAYASLPETKERKKLLAQRSRKLNKLLKEEDTETYNALLKKIVEEEAEASKKVVEMI